MEQGISLCMIVRNEEKCLKNCLNSVKELVDEIIIVDTGSTDRTKEIAEKFTDKIFDFKWNNDFSDARNFSILKATKEWILILDADEVIAGKDHEKIRDSIKSNRANAFIFNLRNYVNDKGVSGLILSRNDEYAESKLATGFTISKVLRFFKNKGYYFEGKIHETLNNSIKKLNDKIFGTDIVIHHFGELDKKRYLDKKKTYIELLKERINKKDFKEKPEDYICFEIAKELIHLNDYDDAIFYLEKAVNINERFEYLFQLGSLYILKKRLDDAEKILKKAVLLNPENSSAHDNLGIIYSEKGLYNKAIKKFEKAIQLNPESADAYFNLGLVYRKKGKISKMRQFFEKAAELNPEYKEKIAD